MPFEISDPAPQHLVFLAIISMPELISGIWLIQCVNPFHQVPAHIIHPIIAFVCLIRTNRNGITCGKVGLILIIFLSPWIFVPIGASGGLFPLLFCWKTFPGPLAVSPGVKPCYIIYGMLPPSRRIDALFPIPRSEE